MIKRTRTPAADTHLLICLRETVTKAWLRHLIRRSCDSTECFLKALDDRTLDRIGLEKADIRAAVRDLEVELLRQLDPSPAILDLQAERS